MNILLTGFGPFPRVPRNPSQAVVEGFPDWLGGAVIHRHVLETVYAVAEREIERLLCELRPDVCLCLGVALPGVLRLETTARNRGDNAGPDHSGVARTDAIAPAGPETYAATLPLDDIAAALRAQEIDFSVSDDAGGYVCNHVFYAARHAIERHGLATRCGFVHLPEVRPDRPEAAEIEDFLRAVRVIVEVLNRAP